MIEEGYGTVVPPFYGKNGGGAWRTTLWLACRTLKWLTMKTTQRTVILMSVALAAQPQVVRPRMPEDVTIFAVRHQAQALEIDPIVIVHYGADQRFTTIPSLNPPLGSEDATVTDLRRLGKIYKAGSHFSVFRGGERLGHAVVRSSNIEGGDGDCVDLSAAISYDSTPPPLLATNTGPEIPGHVSQRRPATSAERAVVVELARQWLSDYGLDKQLLQQGTLGATISTELRKDGVRAIIGRFDVTSKYAIHRLFAIAEQDGKQYHLTLANLEIQHDVEDGTDKAEREYLDQLDINNDGVDEVVSSVSYYESWAYTIWRFDVKHGGWHKSYTGGGGGC